MAEIVCGEAYANLGNAISDAIMDAVDAGMAIDEAVCVVAQVAADYAKDAYGPAYLSLLAKVVLDRAEMDMPGQGAFGNG